MTKKILLLGAYGFTGYLIAQKLFENKINFVAGGRDSYKLLKLKKIFGEKLELSYIDTNSPESIEKAFKEIDLIINCVGPFSQFSVDVIRLASEMGKIYIDITGEQVFVKESWNNYQKIALKNQATIICSCSFESAVADFAAQQICDINEKYYEISSYYEIKDTKPSPGTRLTMQIARSQKTFIYERKEIVNMKPLEIESYLFHKGKKLTAYFVPYPEVYFFSNVYDVQNCGSYFILSQLHADFLKKNTSANQLDATKIIEREKGNNYKGPDKFERQRQSFNLWVKCITQSGLEKIIHLSGTDMYDLTADIVLAGVQTILNFESRSYGFFSPAQYFQKSPFFVSVFKKLF